MSQHQRLSRRIWMRHPTRPCRFIFAPDHELGLVIEAVTSKGKDSFAKQRKRIKEDLEEGELLVTGALLVDENQRYVFCGPKVKPDLLEQLATWAGQMEPELPAVTGLIDAGVAKADIKLKHDDDIEDLDLDKLEIHRQPLLWAELLQPTEALVAATLEACLPGQRMWFWLWADAWADVPPLLLQPVATDPNRDRLDHLIGLTLDGELDDAASGICVLVDDGRLQLMAPDLTEDMLATLATWVREHVAEHPGLARLWNCQLLLTSGGKVLQIIEDASLWEGVPRPTPPGTLVATAATLEGLEEGQNAWFWLGRTGDKGAFLSMARVDSDPEGEAFHDQVISLFERFPGSERGALFGTARRLSSGGLLFTTSNPRVKHWKRAVRAFLDTHADSHEVLAQLEGASLAQLDADGKITQALQAGR